MFILDDVINIISIIFILILIGLCIYQGYKVIRMNISDEMEKNLFLTQQEIMKRVNSNNSATCKDISNHNRRISILELNMDAMESRLQETYMLFDSEKAEIKNSSKKCKYEEILE